MIFGRNMPLTLMLLPLALTAPPLHGRETYDPNKVAWTRLEFEASKFFVTARSEVELAKHRNDVAATELIEPAGAEALRASDSESYLIAINSRVLSQESQVRFWFDADDAQALQRSELSLSKKRQRHRTYRYAVDGVHAQTLRPGTGESEKPYSGWTDIESEYVPFPKGLDPTVVVTDATSLLYVLPAAALDQPGDSTLMYVYSRGDVSPVEITVKAKEQIAVDYLEVSAKGERQVRALAETLRIALRPHLPQGSKRSDLKLLGLEGDIDFYLDPQTRAPLLLTGRIKIAGSVRLHLRRVDLR